MLEKAVKSDKVRAIGISNFEGRYIDEVLEQCERKPQVIQAEAHPYFALAYAVRSRVMAKQKITERWVSYGM